MPYNRCAPSPFGHDPTHPPFNVIVAAPPRPVRDDSIRADEAGVRQVFRNISMPEAPPLQLTVTERFVEPPGEEVRATAEERLLGKLSRLKLFYLVFERTPASKTSTRTLRSKNRPIRRFGPRSTISATSSETCGA